MDFNTIWNDISPYIAEILGIIFAAIAAFIGNELRKFRKDIAGDAKDALGKDFDFAVFVASILVRSLWQSNAAKGVRLDAVKMYEAALPKVEKYFEQYGVDIDIDLIDDALWEAVSRVLEEAGVPAEDIEDWLETPIMAVPGMTMGRVAMFNPTLKFTDGGGLLVNGMPVFEFGSGDQAVVDDKNLDRISEIDGVLALDGQPLFDADNELVYVDFEVVKG